MRALMTKDSDGARCLWVSDCGGDLSIGNHRNGAWSCTDGREPFIDEERESLPQDFWSTLPDIPPGSGPVEVEITITKVMKQ